MSRLCVGGLTVGDWIGRRVLLDCSKNKASRHGRGKINAQLVSVSGSRAVVKPMGHGDTEVVDIEAIHPWWSKNPDLAARRPDRSAA